MPITFLDLVLIILIMVWTAYRMYFSSELYHNIVAEVYSKPGNAVMIIFIEGLIYLVSVYMFFPFGRQARGWEYIIWYVSLILCMWCFTHVIKYFIWKRRTKSNEK